MNNRLNAFFGDADVAADLPRRTVHDYLGCGETRAVTPGDHQLGAGAARQGLLESLGYFRCCHSLAAMAHLYDHPRGVRRNLLGIPH